jgi:hypothetical protein
MKPAQDYPAQAVVTALTKTCDYNRRKDVAGGSGALSQEILAERK